MMQNGRINYFFEYYLGVPQAFPSLAFCLSSSFIQRKITQNLKTSIAENSTNLREIRQYKKTKHDYKYCFNPFIFHSCSISTVFQHLNGKNSSKKTIESSKQTHNAKKTESAKNRTVCSNLDILNTSKTSKILIKLGPHE